MPYFQNGNHIYWWDTDARKRRSVRLGPSAGFAPNPPDRDARSSVEQNEDPDPNHVRDTTVRGPGNT
jgi:hypothetical protein